MACKPSIDTHTHVFTRSLSLVPERRYTPGYDALLMDLIDRLDANGLEGAVLVQPSFLGTDNAFLIEALAVQPQRLRGVVVVDANTPVDALAVLHEAGVRGQRFNLMGRPTDAIFDPAWREAFDWMRARDWHVEVHDRAERLSPIVKHLRTFGLRIVVDHFGLPDPALGAQDANWRGLFADSSGGSDGADVFVKLSAAYRLGGLSPRDLTDELITMIGSDHLLWGSDWPWTQHEQANTYERCVMDFDHW
ncbi:MAG: amidohydrolase family protein, partial [Pseudomonadota bacterium]